MKQAIILDSDYKFLNVLQIKNYENETLKNVFTELITDGNKWKKHFPCLHWVRNDLDIHNHLSISIGKKHRKNYFSIYITIFGDDGLLTLELIPFDQLKKIKI
tara:strand:- start:357 stop:665 length:309 start_codon:yes stop_codon:yes gene_type:complete